MGSHGVTRYAVRPDPAQTATQAESVRKDRAGAFDDPVLGIVHTPVAADRRGQRNELGGREGQVGERSATWPDRLLLGDGNNQPSGAAPASAHAARRRSKMAPSRQSPGAGVSTSLAKMIKYPRFWMIIDNP